LTQVAGDPTAGDGIVVDAGNWVASQTSSGVTALETDGGVAVAQIVFSGAGRLVVDVSVNGGRFVSNRIDWGPACGDNGACSDDRVCTGTICERPNCINGGVPCSSSELCDEHSGRCVNNAFGETCSEAGGECLAHLQCPSSAAGAVCVELCAQTSDCKACSTKNDAECTCTNDFLCAPPS
jgi:hypothetical protein